MKNLQLGAVTLLLVSFLFLPLGIASDIPFADVPFDVTNIPEPVPPPKEVRDFFDLSDFWQQWINIEGFPILGSANVSPYAVKEAAWLLGQMFRHRSDILKILARGGRTFTMIAHNEVVSDIPEHRDEPLLFYWNVRAHGGLRKRMGSTEVAVLSHAYVPIHEMAHAVLDLMYQQLDPPFDNRLGIAYNAAMDKGMWQGTFFALNKIEYWAEGVGVWFHANNQNPVTTREALKAYDPDLALLIAEVFGDHDWRNTPIEMRTHLPHLQGFDPQSAPREVEYPPGVFEAYEELRNPAINERNNWENLPPYDPSLIPNLHALRNRGRDDDVWTYMLIVSTIDAEVLFYWVYPDGTERLVHRFPPNPRQIDLFPCLVGEILLAKDSTGKNLAAFQAVEKTGRVLVAPVLNFITSGLSKFSGDNQGGVPGAILENPFVIEVRDESLSMLEGMSVTFRVTAGDGTLSVTRVTTDENGRAESTLTLGPNPGTNTVDVSVAGIGQPVIFNAVAEAGVHIPNSNLRTRIETALGKAEGDLITPSEMATLTRLDARNANISNLTSLKHATSLTSLNLGHVYVGGRPFNSNSISNILPLAGLTYLTELRLGFNLIADISALAGLSNLTWLDLTGNSVTDIAPVANLTKLTHLDLDGNTISNISPVAGLTNLTFLDIWGTPISDISPVEGLTNLTSLGLGHNNISDISRVAGLTNLTGLYLPSNHITDLSSLSGLTNLKTLWLNQNSISNLSSLVANTGLGSGDTVKVQGNPLSYQSIHTHIPALEKRGVDVTFDSRTPQRIRIVSGDDQQGLPGAALEKPLVVEVQDENRVAFEGVPVTFAVTSGGGMLGTTNTTTDANGRAEITLTLGPNPGTNTVDVSVVEIREKQMFNAQGIRIPKTLEIVSGKDQEGLPGEVLEKAFVVEVRDEFDNPLPDVEVTFSVIRGGGTLSATSVSTDSSGRVASTLTLGPNLGKNSVHVSVEGISQPESFTAIGIRPGFTLSLPAGISLIHIPIRVTAVDDAPLAIEFISDLYDALGGEKVSFLVTRDAAFQRWRVYFGSENRGKSGDKTLTDDLGIIAAMKNAVTIRLEGDALGRDGNSVITLHPGTNLVGMPLRNSQIARVSDLLSLDGIRGNVPSIFVSAQGKFNEVRRAADDGNISITGGQSFVLKARDATTVAISGNGWYNTSGTTAAPSVAVTSIEVENATPVLALGGSIVDEMGVWSGRGRDAFPTESGFRVTAKNLSTSKAVTTVTGDEHLSPKSNKGKLIGVGYQLAVVDMESGRAAQIGDVLEVAAETSNSLIRVRSLRYVVTAEDVKRSRIELAALVAYEIPPETALLPNYPNPFNPETWIPYQLAEDADVTLTIYNTRGVAVRRLDLGHQLAGYYADRGKAAYWDGRNGSGERVASGTYFYHLTVGDDYRSNRRMVILK